MGRGWLPLSQELHPALGPSGLVSTGRTDTDRQTNITPFIIYRENRLIDKGLMGAMPLWNFWARTAHAEFFFGGGG